MLNAVEYWKFIINVNFVISGCWEWQAGKSNGYGSFWVPSKKRTYGAHRVAYQLWKQSDIPPGMVVHHTCDNPGCVNPDHLELVTQSENVLKNSRPNQSAKRREYGQEYRKRQQGQVAKRVAEIRKQNGIHDIS